MGKPIYEVGDEVVVNATYSSFHGLRGRIVEPHAVLDRHWWVLLAQGTVPIMFGERELQKFSH